MILIKEQIVYDLFNKRKGIIHKTSEDNYYFVPDAGTFYTSWFLIELGREIDNLNIKKTK